MHRTKYLYYNERPLERNIMQTLWNATYFAIFLIIMNLVFFIYLYLVSKQIAFNRKILKETSRLTNEFLDEFDGALSIEEERIAKKMIADIDNHLRQLY